VIPGFVIWITPRGRGLDIFPLPHGYIPTMSLSAHRVTVRPLLGLRVLVVDDDRVSLLAITAMVSAWGAEIRSAATAREALRLIEEDTPDLLLSDLYMPEMDGFDLMRRVREMPPGRGGDTPAIAVTAHPSFDSRRDAERAGYGAVFSKPFGHDELIDTILALAKTGPEPS
jgi:CheY-like chemotaxis protein